MNRPSRRSFAALCVAPLLLLAACGSTGGGPTEAFDAHAPRTVFVLAPPPGLVTGAEAEHVRRELMRELREKGYGVTSAADATLLPRVEVWSAQAGRGSSRDRVTLSARLIDREERLLWEDSGYARAELDEDDEDGDLLDGLLDAALSNATARWSKRRERLAEEAVVDLLRSLPDAPRR